MAAFLSWLNASIKRKMVAVICGIIVMLVSALTVAIGWRSAALLSAATESQLAQGLQQAERLMDQFFKVRAANLTLWSSNPLFRSLLDNPALGSVFVPSIDGYFEDVNKQEPWLEGVILLSDGVVAYDGRELLTKYGLTEGSLKEELRGVPFGRGRPTKFTLKEGGGEHSAVLLATRLPKREKNGEAEKAEGVEELFPDDGAGDFLVAFLDVKVFEHELLSSLKVGDSGFVTLQAFSRAGALIPPLKREGVPDEEWTDYMGATKELTGLDSKFPDKVNGVLLRRKTMPSQNLAVVGVASLDDVYAPVATLIRITVLLGIAAALVAMVIAFGFAGRLTAPILALTRTVESLGRGRLEERAEKTTSDEVGVLADNFNEMADRLRERIADIEFLRSFTESLVNIRTLEDLQSEVSRTLSQYLGEGLAHLVMFRNVAEVEELRADRPANAPSPLFERLLYRNSKQTLHGQILVWATGRYGHSPEKLRDILETLSRNVEMAIENILSIVEGMQKAALEVELKTATAVQDALFTKESPTIPGWELANWFTPAAQMGGDWFRVYHDTARNKLRLYIGDVTGHGVSSALLTAAAMAVVHTVEQDHANDSTSQHGLSSTLEKLNRVIREVGRSRLLMTFCICEVDLATAEVQFANAAHNFPMILKGATGTAAESVQGGQEAAGESVRISMVGSGNRLGFSGAPSFTLKSYTIPPGAVLVLYTDGLVEARNASGI